MKKGDAILIADSHVDPEDSAKAEEFFAMLDRLLELPCDVFFLGDVFELWIGLTPYEDALHERFAAWCAKAKESRAVGFIEGNHEYFVKKRRAKLFTWASEDSKLLENGVFLAHGDFINLRDRNYLFMRRVFKSLAAEIFLRALALTGLGNRVAHKIRLSLKGTNLEHKKKIPEDLAEAYAEKCGALGAKKIVVGHFHRLWSRVSKSGAEILLMPEWRDGGTVGVLDRATGGVELKPWSELK